MHQTILNQGKIDPYIFWDISENGRSELLPESYYEGLPIKLYQEAFNSEELIGYHSSLYYPILRIETIDPTINDINQYIIKSGTYFEKKSSSLSYSKLEEFQIEMLKVEQAIDNLLINFKHYQEEFVNIQPEQIAERKLRIDSLSVRTYRLYRHAEFIKSLLR